MDFLFRHMGKAILGLVLFALVNVAAWITHVVNCIQDEQWLFLIAGAVFFPIAMIHGWGIWFGFF